MKSDLVDVDVQLHHETEKALLVSTDGDKAKAKWVPKSQCEISEPKKGSVVRQLTCPQWLAKDKELI